MAPLVFEGVSLSFTEHERRADFPARHLADTNVRPPSPEKNRRPVFANATPGEAIMRRRDA